MLFLAAGSISFPAYFAFECAMHTYRNGSTSTSNNNQQRCHNAKINKQNVQKDKCFFFSSFVFVHFMMVLCGCWWWCYINYYYY